MKRFLLTFLLFLCCFAFCSCKSTPQINPETSCEADVSISGTLYTLQADTADDGSVTIAMLSPENVSGISYHYENGALTVEYDNLKCMTDSNYLPQGAVADSFCKALSALPTAQYDSSEEESDLFISADGRFTYSAIGGKMEEICDEQNGYIFSFR